MDVLVNWTENFKLNLSFMSVGYHCSSTFVPGLNKKQKYLVLRIIFETIKMVGVTYDGDEFREAVTYRKWSNFRVL